MTPLQTEVSFTLPLGYVDTEGNLHRNGTMRLARARDEIAPFEDSRAHANQAYLAVLLLSRVIVRLGEMRQITPEIVEDLLVPDFVYLQQTYLRLNEKPEAIAETQCPNCGERFELDVGGA